MHDPDHDAAPFNALPPVVVVLAVVVGGIEIVLQAAEAGLINRPGLEFLRRDLVLQFGFFDRYFEWMRESGTWPFDGLVRFVAYSLIHYEIMHTLFACVMILAIGKFVGERFSGLSVLLTFILSAVGGALGYGVLLDDPAQLIGAYPAVYGLLGAFTWILFMGLGAKGQNRLQAFQLIAVLLGLQLLFRLIGGGGNDWVADICGFVTGFALAFVLAPDGRARIERWLNAGRRR